MARPYEYTPLQPTAIRLLSITSVLPQVTLSFEAFPEDKVPRYEAISYCWGKDPATERVFNNNQESAYLNVTPNVLGLLEQLWIRKKSSERFWNLRRSSNRFWIDAVCINQADDAEKAQQVRRMGDIFANAQRVLIWLGPAERNSDLAMKSIENLVKYFSRQPSEARLLFPWSEVDEWTKRYGLPAKDHPVWEALSELSNRPWFRRLWVVQEVVLAREAIMLCGGMTLQWTVFVRFAEHLWNDFSILRGEIMERERRCYGLRAAYAFRVWKAASKRSINMYLSAAALIDIREVTEPIDRIYGYLGLMDQNFRARITIDYSAQSRSQYWKTYVQAGKLIIKEPGGLSLLSMVKSEKKLPGLPSWCPNFDSGGNGKVIFTLKDFRAGIDEQAHTSSLTVSTSTDSDAIQISGYRIDVVDTIVDSGFDGMDQWLKWEASCFALSQATLEQQGMSDSDIRKVHGRTLMADHPDLAKDNLPELGNVIKRVMANRQNPQSLNDHLEWADDELLADSYKYLEISVDLRRSSFFSTQNGRIGLATTSIRPGDVVCTLYGAEPLFILRFPKDDPQGPVTLVCDAYVDGFMHLKDVPMEQRGEDEIFTIE